MKNYSFESNYYPVLKTLPCQQFSRCSSFRFKIRKEHNPSEKTRPRSAGGRHERAVEPGLAITTLDFSAKDPTTFVVGTLCGGLYKCNIDRGIPVEGTLRRAVLYNY